MEIAIVGAGVTAFGLRASGSGYERARERRPVGVGIGPLPHAMRELTELGLEITAPATLSYANCHGQSIRSEPRVFAAGYRWPQISIHRGELR